MQAGFRSAAHCTTIILSGQAHGIPSLPSWPRALCEMRSCTVRIRQTRRGATRDSPAADDSSRAITAGGRAAHVSLRFSYPQPRRSTLGPLSQLQEAAQKSLTLLRVACGEFHSKGHEGSVNAGDAWLLLVVSASPDPARPRPRPQCSWAPRRRDYDDAAAQLAEPTATGTFIPERQCDIIQIYAWWHSYRPCHRASTRPPRLRLHRSPSDSIYQPTTRRSYLPGSLLGEPGGPLSPFTPRRPRPMVAHGGSRDSGWTWPGLQCA